MTEFWRRIILSKLLTGTVLEAFPINGSAKFKLGGRAASVATSWALDPFKPWQAQAWPYTRIYTCQCVHLLFLSTLRQTQTHLIRLDDPIGEAFT